MEVCKRSSLNPSDITLRMDGKILSKENCSLIYYGIAHKSLLEGIEIGSTNVREDSVKSVEQKGSDIVTYKTD
jgi:hypothetical protein